MSNLEVRKFIIKARLATYAGEGGKVASALAGSTQLEYSDGDWLYRDVYYTGKNTFYGIETIFINDKPIWGMSYYGNWGEMTEVEIDDILRGALKANPEARLDKTIEWEKGDYVYECQPDLEDGIVEVGGSETIVKNGEQVYTFFYAGSLL